MNRTAMVIVGGLICFSSAGCTTRYVVAVTAYLAEDVPFPAANRDVKLAVVTHSEPKEPLLEKEVQRKIEYLINQRGMSLGSLDESDYILSAFFAIDGGTTKTGSRAVRHSGGVSRMRVYTSSGQWATGTVRNPGYTTYKPYSYTQFRRYLGLDLYERDRWAKTEANDPSEAIAWRATTSSTGSSSDLRSVIDYLLVATFEEFGKDTGHQKESTLRKGDKRVKELRTQYKPMPSR